MTIVVDTSAVLAALWKEPGGELVAKVIDGALISSVNLSEVVAKFIDRGASRETATKAIQALPTTTRDFDDDTAIVAGLLRESTRGLGLSLGDRACLALAIRENAKVFTADKAWAKLNIGVEIEIIR